MPVFPDLQWHPFSYLDACAFHPGDLGGVVRHQADRRKPHLFQDLGPDAEIAFVVFKPQPVVRFDRVEPLILQGIGPHLVGEADAASLLIEIEEDAGAFLADLAKRGASPESPEGYCTVGLEEIAKGSAAGRLLKVK